VKKKIGLLFGQENTFPQALVAFINEKKIDGIIAEPVRVDKVAQAEPTEYAVIIDRISHDVPFYRAYLKNAALNGSAVINNPFWWSADEKFFNNCLAVKSGVAVPKTVILPSHDMPPDTNGNSFRNLAFPLDWEGIFSSVGFPAFFKPHAGGGWKNVYKVHNREEFFAAYGQTGQLVMLLQENIDFTDYYRCYCLGGTNVRIMAYDPRQPHHLRYVRNAQPAEAKLMKTMENAVKKLNQVLGYDFNTVELAIRDGIPYAIDFCNPAPDADLNSIGEENFAWILEHAALLAIAKAQSHVEGKNNLTWGKFVKAYAANKGI
jgi:glutathione synthase/RimK-type ligase-like ATP-grasp enzyme